MIRRPSKSTRSYTRFPYTTLFPSRYDRLAPSLLEKDAWDNWIIARDYYDPGKLTQAVCKLMGFDYQPDETRYWMQGRSSETDFIYVTTQSLTHEDRKSTRLNYSH